MPGRHRKPRPSILTRLRRRWTATRHRPLAIVPAPRHAEPPLAEVGATADWSPLSTLTGLQPVHLDAEQPHLMPANRYDQLIGAPVICGTELTQEIPQISDTLAIRAETWHLDGHLLVGDPYTSLPGA
jgi:hypothetical protein